VPIFHQITLITPTDIGVDLTAADSDLGPTPPHSPRMELELAAGKDHGGQGQEQGAVDQGVGQVG
jgi:hypothetical protein